MAAPESAQVHATAAARGGRAVLLRGPSGAGKSDLALRLIDAGWTLCADDRCDLVRRGAGVWVRAPAALRGKIEARGAGVLEGLPFAPGARLALICDLAPGPHERLPEPAYEDVLGCRTRCVTLDPFEASAPAKISAVTRFGVL